ncbi:MAG TPA: PIN domain-containing protein, partial [Terriglobales bacterium]|nr:PIN domain-containing protein [Terriglobales bacterium]
AWRRHGERLAHEAESKLLQLPIVVIAADRERATRAAAIKERYSLGYADSFAAELATDRNAWLVTADPEFEKMGKALALYLLPGRES